MFSQALNGSARMVIPTAVLFVVLIKRLFLVIMLATTLGLTIGLRDEGCYGSNMLVIDLLWLESMVLDVYADCFSGESLAIDSFSRLLSMLEFFATYCYFKDLAEKVARTTLFAVALVRVCLVVVIVF